MCFVAKPLGSPTTTLLQPGIAYTQLACQQLHIAQFNSDAPSRSKHEGPIFGHILYFGGVIIFLSSVHLVHHHDSFSSLLCSEEHAFHSGMVGFLQ